MATTAEVLLTHVHDTGLLLNAGMQLQFRDSAVNIASDADGMLDIEADNSIDLNIGATETLSVQSAKLVPGADGTVDLGSSGLEFKDLYIDGVAYIDTLNADALGANLDCANYNMTNVDIDSGAMDNTEIGNTTPSTGKFTTLSGSSTLKVGGTVQLAGVADAAASVAADSFYYLDATDSLMKRESMADYAASIAGTGLAASSGQLSLDLSEVGSAVLAAGDSLVFVDSDSGNVTKTDSINDIADLLAGDGLAASNAVLAVQVSGALQVSSDKVGILASFAGTGLSPDAATNYIETLSLDLSELSAASVDVSADSIAIIDANDGNASRKESIADLVAGMAGTGIGASSGALTWAPSELTEAVIATTDYIVFADATDSDNPKKEGVDDLFTIGPALVSEAAVAVSSDYFTFLDGGASGAAKKESIADLVAAMAGAGLNASNGQLSTQAGSVAAIADGGTLAEGYNYLADLSANANRNVTSFPIRG